MAKSQIHFAQLLRLPKRNNVINFLVKTRFRICFVMALGKLSSYSMHFADHMSTLIRHEPSVGGRVMFSSTFLRQSWLEMNILH